MRRQVSDLRIPEDFLKIISHEIDHHLLQRQASPTNRSMVGGYTPLAIAVLQGHLNIVNLLLASGAMTEIADHFGMTPVFFAVLNERCDILETLVVKGGADVNCSIAARY
jgi:ankyrin repeat protein